MEQILMVLDDMDDLVAVVTFLLRQKRRTSLRKLR